MQATLKSHVVLRVESDDFALLYDSPTGESFVLDPVGVFICQRLDGKHTIDRIVEESSAAFDDMPEDAAAQVKEFVDNLIEKNLAEV